MDSKIVLLGASSVGKTALLDRVRLGGGAKVDRAAFDLDATVELESEWKHSVALPDGSSAGVVNLVDTTGSTGQLGEDVRNMHTVFGDAFIIVFSVNDRESYEIAAEHLAEVTRIKKELQHHDYVPLLVVGTFAGEDDEAREVTTVEGKELAAKYADSTFRETSNTIAPELDIRFVDGWLLNEVLLPQQEKKKLSVPDKLKGIARSLSPTHWFDHNDRDGRRSPGGLSTHSNHSNHSHEHEDHSSDERHQMFYKLMSASGRLGADQAVGEADV